MARKSIKFIKGQSVNGQVKLFIVRAYPLCKNFKDVLNFKIYRKKEDEFVQGIDYYEYFDAIDFEQASLIYDGPLEKQEKYYFTYTDTDVEPLDVYAYWVVYEEDTLPVGPIGIAVRDPRVWWTHEKINNEMERLYQLYKGEKQLKTYGYTTRKKDLNALVIGNLEKCIGLMGIIHAGESGPELFLKAAEEIILNHSDLLDEVGLAIFPSVNADCREDMATGIPQYLRCNPNGVDLNRNLDVNWDITDYTYGLSTAVEGSDTYRGPFPHSEDETKAVVHFIDSVQPTVIFCGHSLASICSDSFLTSKEAEGDMAFKDKCMSFITPYTNGFRNVEEEGVSFHYACTMGSIPAYVYKRYGIPTFDMEFRVVKDEKRERACIGGRTTVELLDEFSRYHTDGILNVMKSLV